MPIGIITNPRSGKNRRNPKRLDELSSVLGSRGVIRRTTEPSQLKAVIEEFFELGCEYWVCDGGDGTLHWVLSHAYPIALERGEPWPIIVPANGGTIDFVAAKVGIRGQAVAIVRDLVQLIEQGRRPSLVGLDTLHVIGTPFEGELVERIGFAAAVGGISQRFFDKLYLYERISGWSISDIMARTVAGSVLSTFLPRQVQPKVLPHLQQYAAEVFKPTRAIVEVDGQVLDYEAYSSLEVGSIDIAMGGVVRTFRDAAQPGTLCAQAFGGPAIEVVSNLPNVLLNTPLWGHCFAGPVTQFKATARDGEVLDPVVDGERIFGLREISVRRGPMLQIPVVATSRPWRRE